MNCRCSFTEAQTCLSKEHCPNPSAGRSKAPSLPRAALGDVLPPRIQQPFVDDLEPPPRLRRLPNTIFTISVKTADALIKLGFKPGGPQRHLPRSRHGLQVPCRTLFARFRLRLLFNGDLGPCLFQFVSRKPACVLQQLRLDQSRNQLD